MVTIRQLLMVVKCRKPKGCKRTVCSHMELHMINVNCGHGKGGIRPRCCPPCVKQKIELVEAPPPPEPAKGLPCNDCPNNVTCDRSKFTTDGQGGYHCDEKYKTLYLASRAKTEEPDKEGG